MKGRRIVAGILTAGVLAGCSIESGSAANNPSPNISPSAVPAAELRGFAIGDGWNDKTEAEVAAMAKRARTIGSQVLRLDIEWGRVRPNQQGWYDWTEIDRNLNTAKKTGHLVMATLAYAPEWARDDACRDEFTCAPKDPESYNDFVNEFAHHVAEADLEETVPYIEIWNEQNYGSIDPEKYATMLAMASQSIHMVLQDAKVGFGGMAPNAENEGNSQTAATYLKAVNKALRNNEKKQPAAVYDAVAFHPYSYPAKPGQPYTWNGITQTEGDASTPDAPNLYAAMVAEGIGGMEVWLNEFGAPTCGSVKVTSPEDPKWNDQGGVEPSYQNQIIQDFLNWRFQKMNVTIRLIHTLQDRNSTSPDREDCFGVYDDKGKLKTSSFKLN